ncbi:MAG: flagellar motor switch protein FliN [Bacillota bacterium]|uniref:flagellar motor switch protein FliN n=1 Tax=Desulfurispora thermophila TaxID=265470 RepID=UPI00036414EA|nr:flagellar motor switch protein FliN [Desulfurispora thermophila]
MMTEEQLREFLEKAQPERATVRRAVFSELVPPPAGQMAINIDYLSDIEVVLSARLGSATLKIKEILKLEEGSVIELEQPVGQSVDVCVNGQPVGRAEVVVLGSNFGLRMENIYRREKKSAAQEEEEARA